MNMLMINASFYLKIIINLLFFLILSFKLFSNEISIEIKGNDYTDELAIISLIEDKPEEISEKYSNYLIKTLDNSMMFENVSVSIFDNTYVITITEYPNINKIFFENNERFEDEELEEFSKELNLNNLNPISINLYKSEINNLYETLGYNNIDISHKINLNEITNTADIYFNINEGTITKIKNIFFNGNESINSEILKSQINSKTKNLINIFANNNFKKFIIIDDVRKIKNYYLNNGFADVFIDYKIEYLQNNKVNIYFDITEGDLYAFKSIKILDNNNLLEESLKKNIDLFLITTIEDNDDYSYSTITNIKTEVSNKIALNGIDFFEIKTLEKKEENSISILFEINPIEPKYTNQIKIYGNTRTYDKVIRRELDISEGDAIHSSQLESIRKKLNSLNIFNTIEVVEKNINENEVDIIINVEEKQTGTLNAGLSLGTLEGLGLVAGLKEKNFYGTGRSLSFLLNTTEDQTEFIFETTDRILNENSVDVTYRTKYKEEDFTVSSSYKLNTFTSGVGIGYNVNPSLRHSIDLDYIIKNYDVTNLSTVSSTISNSSGENASFVLQNNLIYNTLNSYILPKKGRMINFSNYIETPTSSNNGYLKNIITYKNYYNIDKNIFSIQSKIGNIISLSNNDILTDNKFSLGGRWLRGFDSFGVGPRNSRSSYIGGNNLITAKLDYSRELTNNSDFPIFFNIFNDYGVLWENKTKPTKNDNNLRSSAGFGLKYYSAIGPIALTWGFPIQDESYDIKRMFLFSVGNID